MPLTASPTRSHLCGKGCSALVVVLPALLTSGRRRHAQLLLAQARRRVVTGESRGVPVQVVPQAPAAFHPRRRVDQRGVVPRVAQAPAAAVPQLADGWVAAPVLRGEALEDDAHVDAGKRHGHQAEEAEDALLAAAELAGLLEDVVESGHDCNRCTGVGGKPCVWEAAGDRVFTGAGAIKSPGGRLTLGPGHVVIDQPSVENTSKPTRYFLMAVTVFSHFTEVMQFQRPSVSLMQCQSKQMSPLQTADLQLHLHAGLCIQTVGDAGFMK